MKAKLSSDDQLLLYKMIEVPNMTLAVRAVSMKITSIMNKLSQVNVCIIYK